MKKDKHRPLLVCQHRTIAQLLLEHSTDITIETTEGFDAIMLAASLGQTAILKVLLSSNTHTHYRRQQRTLDTNTTTHNNHALTTAYCIKQLLVEMNIVYNYYYPLHLIQNILILVIILDNKHH